MLQVVIGAQFARDVRELPFSIQAHLAERIEILSDNPFDTRLHTKPLSGSLQGLFSFRIGRDHRALFRFVDTTSLFLARVAHRKDIYR